MKAIGIDIGTTGISGILIDLSDGHSIKSITKNSEAFLVGRDEWEKIQSVEKIIDIAINILESLIDKDVCAIGVTGQMHGIVYVNERGDAVSPLYTWQDQRGSLPYKDTTYAEYLGSYPGYGNVTDFFNRVNCIRPCDAVTYATIHDYFVMKLCELKSPIIHSSDAHSFGCYDIEKNKFDYDYSAEVTKDYLIVGKYKGIPVSVAIGDNQASVFSTLRDEDGVLVNVGTGSQVSVVSDSHISADGIECRPYVEGKYLTVGSALCGGRAYSLLKNFYARVLGYVKDVSEGDVYAIMEKMLDEARKESLKVNTCFAGTRNSPEKKGSIIGITTENFTPQNLTSGVLSGMVDELYRMYSLMNFKAMSLVGSGNGIRKNKRLVEYFEHVFSAEMKIPLHLEEAALGAALFGSVSAGIFKNAREAQELIKYV